MDISRRNLLVTGIGAAAAGSHAVLRAGAPAAGASEDCFAQIGQGRLRGVRSNGVDAYRGIPYAGSVAGPNRFRAAPPAPTWAGVRDATRLGPPSIQPPGGTMGRNEPPQAEDCLVLNVWTPSHGGHGKPVMVYQHGGGFTSGSGGSISQDGAALARENDVVVVETNHRLGLLGFLYLDDLAGPDYAGSGCRGVQDIAVALRWVARNIAVFGGDSRNVMIFGESGGGAKTSCLYAMPQAAPYFHKASIESGPGIRMATTESAAALTAQVLERLGIPRADWRRLLEVPTADLLRLQTSLGRSGPPSPRPRGGLMSGGFGPVVDGHVLPHHPFDPVAPAISRNKPLIVGGNAEEMAFMAFSASDREAFRLDEAGLRRRLQAQLGDRAEAAEAAYRAERPGASPSDLYFAITADAFSGAGATTIAERKAQQKGAAVYRYVFSYRHGGPALGADATIGAMHAMDIAFKFDNMNEWIAGPRPERVRVGAAMSRMWANFARTGRPSAPGEPAWPAYDLKRRSTMFIDAPCRVVDDPFPAARRFWESA